MVRARVAMLALMIGGLIVPPVAAQSLGRFQARLSGQVSGDVDLCGTDRPRSVPARTVLERELGAFSVTEDLLVELRLRHLPDGVSAFVSEETFEMDSQIHEERYDRQNLSLTFYDGRDGGPCRTAQVLVEHHVPGGPGTYNVAVSSPRVTVHYDAPA